MMNLNLLKKVGACLLCLTLIAQVGCVFAVADGEVCQHRNPVLLKGTPATCGTSGLTDGVMCGDCGEVLLAQDVIPATGNHVNPVKIPGKPATCGKDGLSDGVKCGDCGALLGEQQVIPATGNHTNPVKIPAKEATCTQPGLSEGIKCGDCGTVIVQQQEVTPALGHKPVTVPATKGDCRHPGLSEGVVCEVCGEVLQGRENTGVGDHVMENGVCKICGYKKPSSPSEGLDPVAKTGDITNQVIFTIVAALSIAVVVPVAAVELKRILAK